MKEKDEIRDLLRSKNFRVTQSRMAVASILLNHKNILLSADEIFEKIQNSKAYTCDQVSVYRVLSIFETLKLIKKSTFRGDAARYALRSEQEKQVHDHVHFFKCLKCNIIETIEDCLISKKENELREGGYRNLKHHLEITGICPSCS